MNKVQSGQRTDTIESELDQRVYLHLSRNEISRKGGAVPSRRKQATHERRVKFSLEQAVASAKSNQLICSMRSRTLPRIVLIRS